MNLPVAVADMDMLDPAGEPRHLGRLCMDEIEVGDVAVGHHRLGQADVVEEAEHRVDRVDERQLERLELDGDPQAPVGGVGSELADGVDAELPLLGRRDHLLLPDILPEDEKEIAAAVVGGEIEVGPAAVEVEAAHRGAEVDEAERDAAQAHDRQIELAAGVGDQPPLRRGHVERIGEEIDRVEAESLRLLEAEACPLAGLGKGRVDQSEAQRKAPNGQRDRDAGSAGPHESWNPRRGKARWHPFSTP